MIICCDNSEGSWRYKDYYLVDFKTLDELQNYIQDKLSIKAKQIKLDDNSRYIFTEFDISEDKLIYLSKYKQIYDIDPSYLTEGDKICLTENQCKHCEHYRENYVYGYICFQMYEPSENNRCIYFLEKEKTSFLKWLKSKFKTNFN